MLGIFQNRTTRTPPPVIQMYIYTYVPIGDNTAITFYPLQRDTCNNAVQTTAKPIVPEHNTQRVPSANTIKSKYFCIA